jgi:hypothetical protein
MYLKGENGEFLDFEMASLEVIFELVDSQLDKLESLTSDWDLIGDECEFLVGLGFVSCQRYLVSTSKSKKTALAIGPEHPGGETYAAILNASANYWKHKDEWPEKAVQNFDITVFDKKIRNQELAFDNILIIETVTKWSEYTLTNVLAELTKDNKPRFASLLPILLEWRDQFDAGKKR